jgi:undecaprenyl-diphosphatase
MPARGAPGLWPIRILTDFGKDEYVLSVLGVALVALAFAAAGLHGTRRALLLGLGTRLQFLFLSVALSVFVGEILKFLIGRGRPFVGGKADPFNFIPFEGSGAYASLPSGHAITAFALAFAVSALWPRLRVFMFTYAIVILLTRLVLLAHHPSDVTAGALVGIVGAMAVRYWFAARRLGFAIRADGTIVPLPGPPHKSGCLPGPPVPRGAGQFQPRASFVDVPAFGFHRRSRAQRSRQHRAPDRGDHSGARRPLGLRDHLRQ